MTKFAPQPVDLMGAKMRRGPNVPSWVMAAAVKTDDGTLLVPRFAVDPLNKRVYFRGSLVELVGYERDGLLPKKFNAVIHLA